jgi:hypothetical protein
MKHFFATAFGILGALFLVPSGCTIVMCAVSSSGCYLDFMLGIPFLLGLSFLFLAVLLGAKDIPRAVQAHEKHGPMVFCPKCGKETPGTQEQCLWCNHNLHVSQKF